MKTLSEERIKERLKTDCAVKVYEEVTSTNTVLKQMAEAGEKRTVAVITDFQTQGRGRRGRGFYSPKGDGIYLSILLHPKENAEDGMILTAQAAVAVRRAIQTICATSVMIKWVNDLYLEGKKVCGILTEGVIESSGKVSYMIVGIGINLYTPKEGYPKELERIAASLSGLTQQEAEQEQKKIDAEALAAEVINQMQHLREEGGLPEEYRRYNLVKQRWVRVEDQKQSRTAFVEDILKDGRLLLNEENGSQTILSFGEVSIRL